MNTEVDLSDVVVSALNLYFCLYLGIGTFKVTCLCFNTRRSLPVSLLRLCVMSNGCEGALVGLG